MALRNKQLVMELMDAPQYPTIPQLLRAANEKDATRWFEDEAEVFRNVDMETSKKLIERYRCIPKHCYQNCFHADITGDFLYYEGYVIVKENPFLVIAHSWLVAKDNGDVIDVTLPTIDNVGEAYIGVEIPRAIINRLAFKLEVTGDFLYHIYAKEVGLKPKKTFTEMVEEWMPDQQ